MITCLLGHSSSKKKKTGADWVGSYCWLLASALHVLLVVTCDRKPWKTVTTTRRDWKVGTVDIEVVGMLFQSICLSSEYVNTSS